MKLIICSTAAFLWSLLVFSQDKYFTVTGKVLDEKTKQPMPNASVFCQNTTIGTTCDSSGNFHLRLGNGGYDLVVSYTGFETRLIRISNGNKENSDLTVELKEQDKSMAEVVVAGSAEVADGWNKYGQFFLNNFIGTSPNAEQCSLENKEALKFYFYKKRNKLKVRAKEDLIIINHALGYKIKYQLDSFVYEYNNNIGSYTGYPLFEELTGTEDQQKDWKNNRFKSYLGSRLHFMRCWYDSTLTDEGFMIEMQDSADNSHFIQIKDPYDPKIYAVDSGDVNIDLKGRIRINYGNRVPDKKYLMDNKFPLTAKQQISVLDITDGFVIEENGYFFEQSEVTNIGYWAWKKLAELLPYDYNPE
jgi:CarboxypepD_reg-like domain